MKKQTPKKDFLSSHAVVVLHKAEQYARQTNAAHIEPEHILAALIIQEGSLAYEILKKHGLVPPPANAQLSLISEQKKSLPLSNASQELLLEAYKKAARERHWYVGTEHILNAMLTLKLPDAFSALLRRAHVSERRLSEHLKGIMKSASKLSEFLIPFSADEDVHSPATTKHHLPTLELFGRELTARHTLADMHPFIGREREIQMMMSILLRRYKNNPLLIGDPGVGKTALVEGLAQRIMRGDVPPSLARKRIFTLDLAQMVAGTAYRGEFENRLKQLVQELEQHPDIIVFVDEAHVLVGAGSASGSLDAATMLKPALARGDIRCIGATTFQEYKQHIEHDPALARRFQVIRLSAPSAQETRELITRVSSFYETYHRLRFAEDALDSVVTLTERYVPDRAFPDKALDLLDEAAARVRLRQEHPRHLQKRQRLTGQLENIRQAKYAAFGKNKFDLAWSARTEEKIVHQLLHRLEREPQEISLTVTASDIAATLAQRLNVPLEIMTQNERERLKTMPGRLNQSVIGQTEAVQIATETLIRARANLHDPQRPLASFFFLGPSGVGKTLLAQQLATELFGSTDALVRFNMSEFSERFTVSTLLGAPAGYVGYQEGGALTEWIKHHPYSIILFDEIEKAHPDVWNLFLQILDDGRLRDAEGHWVDCHQTIIIFTSNVGLDLFTRAAGMGFSDQSGSTADEFAQTVKQVRQELQKIFPLEFINRLDQTVFFHPLDKPALIKILRRELTLINQRLTTNHVRVTMTKSAEEFIVTTNYSATAGARRLQRVLLDAIERPISQRLLDTQPTTEKPLAFKLTVKQGKLALI